MSDTPWIVMLEQEKTRWGGDLRRGSIFRGLAARTNATMVNGWSPRYLRPLFGAGPWMLPLPIPLTSRRGALHRLATSEMVRPDLVAVFRRRVDPTAVAIYDDQIAQGAALGIKLPRGRERFFRKRRDANLSAFRWHVVPSASFAELVGMDLDRVIVAGNGTNVNHIRPGPWPQIPTIGMVSGAAPGRGIGTLIEAARLVRQQIPEARLSLWLVPTGAASAEYLADLERTHERDEWISIGTVPYEHVGSALATATVLAIPAPPGDYFDVGLPVKLYDSMAAGRPLVVTPRRETRAIVERHGVGVVSGDDTPESLAGAMVGLLSDETAARQMGIAARHAAETEFHWPIVSDRIAVEILQREGDLPA